MAGPVSELRHGCDTILYGAEVEVLAGGKTFDDVISGNEQVDSGATTYDTTLVGLHAVDFVSSGGVASGMQVDGGEAFISGIAYSPMINGGGEMTVRAGTVYDAVVVNSFAVTSDSAGGTEVKFA